MVPPPPPGPPPPVGPPGMLPPPPPGPPLPVGPPLPDGPPGAGDVSDGGTLDGAVVVVVDVVVDGVVLLLGPLLPPPQATAMTSMAPPPKTANAVLASVLIRTPLSFQAHAHFRRMRLIPREALAQTAARSHGKLMTTAEAAAARSSA
ncbi:hypothetical protein LAUMK13_02793 [Mycobacterium innocens]|uniref:Uncharacterized protein n=1 Tax=Mycobacterium innocens TaxID=2341083 RepID=A0A498Q5N2_9MYCO|nr:hypothetical protein LAUMK13_02793 [Mycobacterium innocens]